MTKIEKLKAAIVQIDARLAQKEIDGRIAEDGMYSFYMSYGIGHDYASDAVDLSGMQIAHDILKFARTRVLKEMEVMEQLIKDL